MASVLVPSVVDRGFHAQSCQTKDYKIGMLLLLRWYRSIKEYKQRLVDDISTFRLLFQWASIIKIQLSLLV